MAKVKRSAGKGKKAVRKSAPRKSVKQAPAAAKAAKVERTFPCTVLVKKGADGIPVQVKDQAGIDKLVQEHGEASVEVQS